MFQRKLNSILKLLNLPVIKWIIIPIILFLIWPLLSYLFISHESLTTIYQPENLSKTSSFKEGKLLKGEKIKGEFAAKYDNLGIVSIHMGLFINNLINTDTLVFRIKEKNNKAWYYKAEIDSGFFLHYEYSPFGFPPISNSKGKKYVFEIESVTGTKNNSIIVKRENPIYIAKFKYPKEQILKNNLLIKEVINNFRVIFLDLNFIFSSLIFILPFFFYALYHLYKKVASLIKEKTKKEIYKHKAFFVLSIVLLLLTETILIRQQINAFYIAFIIIWGIFVHRVKLTIKVSIMITIIILIFSMLLANLSLFNALNKASTWIYVMLLLILVQLLLEIRKNK